MAILKKDKQCDRCGQNITAGSEVEFTKADMVHKDSRGFTQSRKPYWRVMHASILDCYPESTQEPK